MNNKTKLDIFYFWIPTCAYIACVIAGILFSKLWILVGAFLVAIELCVTSTVRRIFTVVTGNKCQEKDLEKILIKTFIDKNAP